jgi:hypothetical protein
LAKAYQKIPVKNKLRENGNCRDISGILEKKLDKKCHYLSRPKISGFCHLK